MFKFYSSIRMEIFYFNQTFIYGDQIQIKLMFCSHYGEIRAKLVVSSEQFFKPIL